MLSLLQLGGVCAVLAVSNNQKIGGGIILCQYWRIPITLLCMIFNIFIDRLISARHPENWMYVLSCRIE